MYRACNYIFVAIGVNAYSHCEQACHSCECALISDKSVKEAVIPENASVLYAASFFIVKLMSVIFVILAVYMSIYKMEHKSSFFFFTCVFFAAFFYEVVALAILDKIGEEEKLTHSDGIITYAYGLMGTIVALGLWCLCRVIYLLC